MGYFSNRPDTHIYIYTYTYYIYIYTHVYWGMLKMVYTPSYFHRSNGFRGTLYFLYSRTLWTLCPWFSWGQNGLQLVTHQWRGTVSKTAIFSDSLDLWISQDPDVQEENHDVLASCSHSFEVILGIRAWGTSSLNARTWRTRFWNRAEHILMLAFLNRQ